MDYRKKIDDLLAVRKEIKAASTACSHEMNEAITALLALDVPEAHRLRKIQALHEVLRDKRREIGQEIEHIAKKATAEIMKTANFDGYLPVAYAFNKQNDDT